MARHHKSHKGHGMMRGTTGTYSETEGMGRYSHDMINEDKSNTANLPHDVKMTAYPNSFGYLPGEYLDDTIRGIDEQQKQDHEGMMKQMKARKGF